MVGRTGLLIALIARAGVAQDAQEPDLPRFDVSVEVKHGRFVFEKIQLFRPSAFKGAYVADPNGTVLNQTTVAWKKASFLLTFHGMDRTGERKALEFHFDLDYVDPGKRRPIHKYLPSQQFPFVNVESVEVSFEGGERKLTDEEASAEEADRVAQLAKLPQLWNTRVQVFIGRDQECLKDYRAALAIGAGLAVRKKIAELIQFDCGFLQEPGSHARVIRRVGDTSEITIVDDHLNPTATGWVASSWLRMVRPKGRGKLDR